MTRRFESVLPFLLLTLYALVSLRFLGNWGFTSDDANVLMSVSRLKENPFWFGTHSSFGIPYPPFIFYLYGLFYHLHPALISVQLGIIAVYLLGHYFLIRIGKELGEPWLGYFVSAAFFLSPSFFVLYNQKFWEIALFPAFSAAALWCLLRFVATHRWWYLISAFVALMLCMGSHLGAVLFVPTILICLFVAYKARPFPVPVGRSAVLAIFVLLGTSNFIFWLMSSGSVEKYFGLPGPRAFAPFEVIVNLLGGFNNYIPSRIGLGQIFWPRSLRYIPESLLLLAFFALSLKNYRSFSVPMRIVFYWISVPLGSAVLLGIFLDGFPHQWAVILFPGLWFAVLLPVFSLPENARYMRAALLTGVLMVNGANSLRYAAQIEETGGDTWHFATVGTKDAVFDSIYAKVPDPAIYLATKRQGLWWYDANAWLFLAKQRASKAASSQTTSDAPRVFYIYQEDSFTTDPQLRRELEKMAGCEEARIKSVTIFRCTRGKPSTGIPLF